MNTYTVEVKRGPEVRLSLSESAKGVFLAVVIGVLLAMTLMEWWT